MDNEEVIASVVGTVERVNKLVTVRAIRTRCVCIPFNHALFDVGNSKDITRKLGILLSVGLPR